MDCRSYNVTLPYTVAILIVTIMTTLLCETENSSHNKLTIVYVIVVVSHMHARTHAHTHTHTHNPTLFVQWKLLSDC